MARSLGISSLVEAIEETLEELETPALRRLQISASSSAAAAIFGRLEAAAATNAAGLTGPLSPAASSPASPTQPRRTSLLKRDYLSAADSPLDMRLSSEAQDDDELPAPPPSKQTKLAASVPLLHSILTQLPFAAAASGGQPTAAASPINREQQDIWGLFGLKPAGLTGLSALGPNNNLANILSAAAKLKQVADKAMGKEAQVKENVFMCVECK